MNAQHTVRALAILTTLTVALGSGAARADNIDLKLLGQGPRLIQECKERGYQRVGTLKFRVKVPGQSDLFATEPLCSNLADRLENLLVLSIDPKDTKHSLT